MTSSAASPATPALRALLGDRPLLSLWDAADPDTCVSLRLLRLGASWFGVLDARAAVMERFAVGLPQRFLLHVDDTPAIQGVAAVRVHGAIGNVGPSFARLAASLVALQPFGAEHGVLVEVSPVTAAVDPADDGSHGAIPRT
jgi:hypothetical protein